MKETGRGGEGIHFTSMVNSMVRIRVMAKRRLLEHVTEGDGEVEI